MYPKYTLSTENGEFLLNAKKKAYNKLSNYLISMEEGVFEKKRDSFIGKLRATTGKIKYVIYDDGESSKDFFKNANISRYRLRKELAAIMYSHKINKNTEVQMKDFLNTTVVIPFVNTNYKAVEFKPIK